VRPTHGQVRQIAIALEEFLQNKVCGTFPRGEANRFIQRFGAEGGLFIAEMEMFHSTIAGYCSSGSKWLQADEQRMSDCRIAVEKPFFEQHSKYRQFEPQLAAFPDLAEVMGLYEAARKRLKSLMATIEQLRKQ